MAEASSVLANGSVLETWLFLKCRAVDSWWPWSTARLSTTSIRCRACRACKMNASLPRSAAAIAALVFCNAVRRAADHCPRVAENCSSSSLDRCFWDPAHAFVQLGVRPTHDLGHDRDDLVEERLATTHLVCVEHGPSQQAADHIALLLRPRANVFVDAKGRALEDRRCGDASSGWSRSCLTPSPPEGRDDRLEDIGLEAVETLRCYRPFDIYAADVLVRRPGASSRDRSGANWVNTRFQIFHLSSGSVVVISNSGTVDAIRPARSAVWAARNCRPHPCG